MKYIILAAVSLAVLPSLAHALAGQERGGGDICEDRIKMIRDDLGSWINKGGSAGIQLPSGLSLSSYNQKMEQAISKAQIECVSAGDRDYPVEVYGRAKVCMFNRNQNLIICDSGQFQTTPDDGQYRLVHHELAGLAGIEQPDQADSHYEISNQISDYLAEEIVRKLAVHSQATPPVAIGESGAIENDMTYGHSISVPGTCEEIDVQKTTVLLAQAYAKFGQMWSALYGFHDIRSSSVQPSVNSVHKMKAGTVVDANFGIQYTTTNGTLLDLKLSSCDPVNRNFHLVPGARYMMSDKTTTSTDVDGNITAQISYCIIGDEAITADLVNHQYQTVIGQEVIEDGANGTYPLGLDHLNPLDFKKQNRK